MLFKQIASRVGRSKESMEIKTYQDEGNSKFRVSLKLKNGLLFDGTDLQEIATFEFNAQGHVWVARLMTGTSFMHPGIKTNKILFMVQEKGESEKWRGARN